MDGDGPLKIEVADTVTEGTRRQRRKTRWRALPRAAPRPAAGGSLPGGKRDPGSGLYGDAGGRARAFYNTDEKVVLNAVAVPGESVEYARNTTNAARPVRAGRTA
jgi:hypothetical protein